MVGRLQNKVAIVTGAAMGNGLGIAAVFAREGAQVAMFDFSDKVFESAAEIEKSGGKAVAYKVDIRDADGVKQAVDSVAAKFSRIDILANNAGIGIVKLFLETTDEERDRQIFTNVFGTWNMCKAVVPYMVEKKYGKIVNIGSITGNLVCDPGFAAYAASKAAITGFTKALAIELVEHNINVNAIHPGMCRTPIWDKAFAESGVELETMLAEIVKVVPAKRMAEPEELGELAAFLASDAAGYIIGQSVVMDGGLTLPETSGAQDIS